MDYSHVASLTMSHIAQTPTPNKKRKHIHVHAGAVETVGAASPVKRSKKKGDHSKHKGKNKDKGKEEKSSEFKLVRASLVVSIPPVFASNPRAGVEEMLDSMVMRYTPAFTGVVIAHSNLHFIQDTATIKADCPFAVCKVSFDATVWSPRIGMKLVGQINLHSPDHISLLVHRTFNVSIPRHHIPIDHWEFEYGAAENDPEFGAGMGGEQSEDVLIGDRNLDEGEREEKEEEQGEGGRWVHSITGARLGGLDGFLEFTVIGFTIANEMLSLCGSIQPDPFSPLTYPRLRLK